MFNNRSRLVGNERNVTMVTYGKCKRDLTPDRVPTRPADTQLHLQPRGHAEATLLRLHAAERRREDRAGLHRHTHGLCGLQPAGRPAVPLRHTVVGATTPRLPRQLPP